AAVFRAAGFFAAAFFAAGFFAAVLAAGFFAAAFFAGAFAAFFTADFFAAGFLAVAFFAAGFLAAFLAVAILDLLNPWVRCSFRTARFQRENAPSPQERSMTRLARVANKNKRATHAVRRECCIGDAMTRRASIERARATALRASERTAN